MAILKTYHGSREGTGHSGANSGGLGDWFGTNSKEYAQRYGKVGRYNVELNKPYSMDVHEFRSFDRGFDHREAFKRSKKYREELEQKGHDGIIVTHHDGVKEFILFNKQKATPIISEEQKDQ